MPKITLISPSLRLRITIGIKTSETLLSGANTGEDNTLSNIPATKLQDFGPEFGGN